VRKERHQHLIEDRDRALRNVRECLRQDQSPISLIGQAVIRRQRCARIERRLPEPDSLSGFLEPEIFPRRRDLQDAVDADDATPDVEAISDRRVDVKDRSKKLSKFWVWSIQPAKFVSSVVMISLFAYCDWTVSQTSHGGIVPIGLTPILNFPIAFDPGGFTTGYSGPVVSKGSLTPAPRSYFQEPLPAAGQYRL
jgi:hypothetical protein